MEPNPGGEAPKHVILLVHGIRTQAEWAASIRELLEDPPHTVVKPVRYGFFDSMRFLMPFKGLKSRKVKIVEQAIRDIQQRFPEARLSILAHSFGCYIVGRILDEEPDIQLHRLVLCGSVLRRNFNWVALPPDRISAVVNDCGWHDIWPVLAESVTWGYGASGRFGFEGGTRVEDRFHALAHSDFLTVDFARKYWQPFLHEGRVVPGAGAKQPTTPLWVSLLGVLRLRYLFLVALLAVLALGLPAARSTFLPPPAEPPLPADPAAAVGEPPTAVGVPRPIAEDLSEEFFPSHPGLKWAPYETSDDTVEGYEIRLSRSSAFAESITQNVGDRPFVSLSKVRELMLRFSEQDGPVYWSVRADLESGGPTPWSPTHDFTLYNDVLDRISQRKRLRIGVSESQEDLFSCKGLHGEWLGIDMDLVRRLIPFLEKELGVTIQLPLEVETYAWPVAKGDMAEAAKDRLVDFVVSSVTGKASRERDWGIQFTRPYFFANQTIVQAPGKPQISIDDLRGRRIGGQGQTTNWAYAEHLGTSAEPYTGNNTMGTMIQDLENGRLDAFFLDEPFALMRNRVRARLNQAPLVITRLEPSQLEEAGFPQPHTETYAILLHPGEHRLKEVLDRGLDELEEQGFLKLLIDKSRLESPCPGT